MTAHSLTPVITEVALVNGIRITDIDKKRPQTRDEGGISLYRKQMGERWIYPWTAILFVAELERRAAGL